MKSVVAHFGAAFCVFNPRRMLAAARGLGHCGPLEIEAEIIFRQVAGCSGNSRVSTSWKLPWSRQVLEPSRWRSGNPRGQYIDDKLGNAFKSSSV